MSVLTRAATITSGLVLYLDAANRKSYPGTGTTWFDMSGNSVNGTLTNGPFWNQQQGGSIAFDGVNDFVVTSITNFVTSTATPHSGFVWMNIANYAQGCIWQYGEYNDNDYAVGLAMTSGGYLAWPGNGGGSLQGVSQVLAPKDQWIYAGITRTGASTVFYLNSVGVGPYTFSYGSTMGTDPVTIGVGSTNQTRTGAYFSGSIALVQLYNRVLSPSEVLQNYNATKARFGL